MISVLDIGLGILILLFLVRGMLRGLVAELAGLVAIFLGLFLAKRLYPHLSPQFREIVQSAQWADGIAYVLIFIATIIVVALCAVIVRRLFSVVLANWLDSLLGAVLGVVEGLLICAVILALMRRFVPNSPFLSNSDLATYLQGLTGFVRDLLPSFL